MNVSDCIKMRRSIRKYKPDHIDHSIIDSIISIASYSPSWKNTQITRYIAIEDPSILKKIADDYTPVYNSNIIRQIPMLVAVTFIKADPVLNVTDPTAQKRETDGRCLTLVLLASLSVLLQRNRDLAL